MRISDWSSDVCSSDLARRVNRLGHRLPAFDLRVGPQARRRWPAESFLRNAGRLRNDQPRRGALAIIVARQIVWHESGRSEEHTSELQSLMRISYAVFCLKKKKQPKQ